MTYRRPTVAILMGLSTFLAPAATWAQSVETWSLPDPTATQGSKQQGPVDPQNPVIVDRSTPTPTATPTPRPTATAPRPQATATPRTAPSPNATATAEPRRAAPDPSPTRQPTEQPSPAPSPSATSEGAEQDWYVAPGPIAQQEPQPLPERDEGPAWLAWWWIVPAALLALVAALLVIGGAVSRRRSRPYERYELDTPDADAPQPAPEASDVAVPAPTAPTPPLRPVPASNAVEKLPVANTPSPSVTAHEGVAVTLVPGTLRLSLFYATLPYTISLSGMRDGSFSIHADLSSAHASQSSTEQLAPPVETLVDLGVQDGTQDAVLTGELQVPLNAIRTVRQGQTAAFVPLVRIACLRDGQVVSRHAFIAGQTGAAGGLQPVRLDLGPRDVPGLSARPIPVPPVSAASKFPLDRAQATG